MKYPGAAKGVKKLFVSEVLSLVAFLFLCSGLAVIIITAAKTGEADFTGGLNAAWATLGVGLILLVAFFVFAVIAEILRLIGVAQSAADEPAFKTAIFLIVAGAALYCISGVLMNYHIAFSILYTVSDLFSFFAMLFIISGVVKLADRLNRGDISAKGSSIVKILLLVQCLGFIAGIVSSFTGNVFSSIVTGVLYLTVIVLDIVQSIMCISFYSKAKKMLIQGK